MDFFFYNIINFKLYFHRYSAFQGKIPVILLHRIFIYKTVITTKQAFTFCSDRKSFPKSATAIHEYWKAKQLNSSSGFHSYSQQDGQILNVQ